MTAPFVPTLDHLKKAYSVTSQATQITPHPGGAAMGAAALEAKASR